MRVYMREEGRMEGIRNYAKQEDNVAMEHQIKILESFADAVYSGEKNFEVRKNDRGYQKGDVVW